MAFRGRLAIALAVMVLLFSLPLPLLTARAAYSMPYAIEVDITNQIVTIYEADTHAIVRQMLCSSGTETDHTPTGTFYMESTRSGTDRVPWYRIDSLYVRYPTRIQGKVLFHSIPYLKKSLQAIDPVAKNKLGERASHGCIRVRWQDAQFISENCMPGTQVRIYESSQQDDIRRQLLLEETYDSSRGLSFNSFYGISADEDALARFSQGEAVSKLQKRLRELGLFDGEVTGTYDGATVKAVRKAQYLLGMDMSGVATEDLLRRLDAEDAPTATDAILYLGLSGPTVRHLQDSLAALRLCEDARDGVFSAAMVEAVKRFEGAYGWDVDGVARPLMQRAAAWEAEQLERAFDGGDYTLTVSGESVLMARASEEVGAVIREDATRESAERKQVSGNSRMIVLDRGLEWSRVRSGSTVGFVENATVDFFERELTLLIYEDAAGRSYTIGRRAGDYRETATMPCTDFAATAAARGQDIDVDRLAGYVTVDTKGEGFALNLRAMPDVTSVILDEVADGQRLQALCRGDEWTRVSYRGQVGYLLNRYLNPWTGLEGALEDVSVSRGASRATVESVVGNQALVYCDDRDDAATLGRVSDGAVLDVLDWRNDWCLVGYQGREGYMLTEDLTLSQEPTPVTVRPETLDGPVEFT